MARKSYKPEEIVAKLRQVDVLTSQGQSVAEAIRWIGISEVTYYLYGRLSLLQDWDRWPALIRGKHLSGVSRLSAGAPKWGIRTRAPLQLVGLAGLDNSQAPRASVRSVQSISPWPRNRLVASGDGAIGWFATAQHGPDNPCGFVGDGNRCAVEAASLPKIIDPTIVWVEFVRRSSHNSPGAVHQ